MDESAIIVPTAAIFYFFCLVGLGHLLARVLRWHQPDSDSDGLRDFWCGFAGLIFLLQIWQLFVRIDWRANAAFTVLGIIGLAVRWKSCKKTPGGGLRYWLAVSGIAAVFLGAAFIMAIQPIRSYDSGLYHMNSIRWANQFAIVPGLGNLHGRLAFNQTQFLYIAFLNGALPWRMGHNFGHLLIYAALILEGARAMVASLGIGRKEKIHIPRLTWILTLPMLALMMNPAFSVAGKYLAGPSPDSISFALTVAVLGRLVMVIFPGENSAGTRRANLAVVVALASAAVTAKLSFVAFGAASVLLGLVCFSKKMKWRDFFRAVISPGLFAVAILLCWMLRGVITSGYIAYPVTLGKFDCDWRVPEASANLERLWIASWARQPGLPPKEVLADWRWLDTWIESPTLDLDVIRPLMVFIIALAFSLGVGLFFKNSRQDCRLPLVFLPLLVGAAFWFFAAPDPRFSGGVFWCLALLGCVMLTNRWLSVASLGASRLIVAVSLALGVVLSLVIIIPLVKIGEKIAVYSYPRHQMEKFVTDSGLILLVPVGEPQAWDSPLPATPYPDKKLRLRGKGLQSGFYSVER